MPELASVFIDGDACEFSNCGRLYYDNDDDDREEEEDEDDKDEDKDEDKGEDKDEDKGEKEEDIEDIEDEEDALYDQAVVMKSAKRGENERIDLPKLTSFHVEDGYTLSRAHSILFSGFAATLS